MTAPATPAQPTPGKPALTHACARCGAPVALDVGLCERCNPLGLKDSASSQVHGTVFLGIVVAIALLAIAARVAVGGIGPFEADITTVRAAPGDAAGVVVTITVTNQGSRMGSATCRVTDPADRGLNGSAVLLSPRIEPGATITFEQQIRFGTAGQPLNVACTGP
jgi:hypothetical protein